MKFIQNAFELQGINIWVIYLLLPAGILCDANVIRSKETVGLFLTSPLTENRQPTLGKKVFSLEEKCYRQSNMTQIPLQQCSCSVGAGYTAFCGGFLASGAGGVSPQDNGHLFPCPRVIPSSYNRSTWTITSNISAAPATFMLIHIGRSGLV